jgi:hypothetical protein
MLLYSHQQQLPNTNLVNYWVIQNRFSGNLIMKMVGMGTTVALGQMP